MGYVAPFILPTAIPGHDGTATGKFLPTRRPPHARICTHADSIALTNESERHGRFGGNTAVEEHNIPTLLRRFAAEPVRTLTPPSI